MTLQTYRPWRRFTFLITVFWLLTKDDSATFVVPNTIFGLFGALAGPTLANPSNDAPDVLLRLPLVVLFNWSNLLVFGLANQRLPESALGDSLNKPWRPVPSGLITGVQARRTMLFSIPAVLVGNHFFLGAGAETALIQILTWLYNDLKGGDENWILRNATIAVAFGFFNLGSLRIAHGSFAHYTLTDTGTIWIAMVSGVISSTIHVQDLKDREGDEVKGRSTAPIVLGDRVSRCTIAISVWTWSLICTQFWALGVRGLGSTILGLIVATHCLVSSGKAADRLTGELWALWIVTLYIMPCLHYAANIVTSQEHS
ncbi:UbiA prenyltransferase family [Durotheca rogersii]|uniref:UbiA prenyltransferase family n=1 Tax=Durotheca rogersii TaxID=419775 RepID=UPI0022200862|nr:UbiA prenyltransferase family [Durotheca rogersii]KAI5859440.1 UbiA prenyltransferase family [Durotheca rogersii]